MSLNLNDSQLSMGDIVRQVRSNRSSPCCSPPENAVTYRRREIDFIPVCATGGSRHDLSTYRPSQ